MRNYKEYDLNVRLVKKGGGENIYLMLKFWEEEAVGFRHSIQVTWRQRHAQKM